MNTVRKAKAMAEGEGRGGCEEELEVDIMQDSLFLARLSSPLCGTLLNSHLWNG